MFQNLSLGRSSRTEAHSRKTFDSGWGSGRGLFKNHVTKILTVSKTSPPHALIRVIFMSSIATYFELNEYELTQALI